MESNIHKTTFCTRYGHYEFTVVPFGIMNALVVFMSLMNGVFCTFLDNFMFLFLDEMLIYSHDEEEHEEKIR